MSRYTVPDVKLLLTVLPFDHFEDAKRLKPEDIKIAHEVINEWEHFLGLALTNWSKHTEFIKEFFPLMDEAVAYYSETKPKNEFLETQEKLLERFSPKEFEELKEDQRTKTVLKAHSYFEKAFKQLAKLPKLPFPRDDDEEKVEEILDNIATAICLEDSIVSRDKYWIQTIATLILHWGKTSYKNFNFGITTCLIFILKNKKALHETLEKAIRDYPNELYFRIKLAYFYCDQVFYEKAKQVIEEAEKKFPNSYELLYAKFKVLYLSNADSGIVKQSFDTFMSSSPSGYQYRPNACYEIGLYFLRNLPLSKRLIAEEYYVLGTKMETRILYCYQHFESKPKTEWLNFWETLADKIYPEDKAKLAEEKEVETEDLEKILNEAPYLREVSPEALSLCLYERLDLLENVSPITLKEIRKLSDDVETPVIAKVEKLRQACRRVRLHNEHRNPNEVKHPPIMEVLNDESIEGISLVGKTVTLTLIDEPLRTWDSIRLVVEDVDGDVGYLVIFDSGVEELEKFAFGSKIIVVNPCCKIDKDQSVGIIVKSLEYVVFVSGGNCNRCRVCGCKSKFNCEDCNVARYCSEFCKQHDREMLKHGHICKNLLDVKIDVFVTLI